MAEKKLHITELKKEFKNAEVISTSDIVGFYLSTEPNIPRSTVNWRVYDLVNRSVLTRIGKGKFRLNSASLPQHTFIPEIKQNVKRIHSFIKKNFPFITYCIWDASLINGFSHNISNNNSIYVDCERGVTEEVYYKLKQVRNSVFHMPRNETLEWYVTDFKDPVIVRPLISEAPIQFEEDVPTITLEKLLVDLFADPEFYYLQGNEYRHIFENAISRYSINEDKLLRYAGRKGKKEEMQDFLKKIKDRHRQL
jgi:hypothetical protein